MSDKENFPHFLPTCNPSSYEREIKKMQDDIIQNSGIYLPDKLDADVAIPICVGADIVGFGFLFIDGDEAKLMRMISPVWQHKKLGTELLQQIEKVAKSKGVKKLFSQVRNTKEAIASLVSQDYRIHKIDDDRTIFVKDL